MLCSFQISKKVDSSQITPPYFYILSILSLHQKGSPLIKDKKCELCKCDRKINFDAWERYKELGRRIPKSPPSVFKGITHWGVPLFQQWRKVWLRVGKMGKTKTREWENIKLWRMDEDYFKDTALYTPFLSYILLLLVLYFYRWI